MSHLIYEFDYYETELNRTNLVKIECIFMNDPSIRICVRLINPNGEEICWGGIADSTSIQHIIQTQQITVQNFFLNTSNFFKLLASNIPKDSYQHLMTFPCHDQPYITWSTWDNQMNSLTEMGRVRMFLLENIRGLLTCFQTFKINQQPPVINVTANPTANPTINPIFNNFPTQPNTAHPSNDGVNIPSTQEVNQVYHHHNAHPEQIPMGSKTNDNIEIVRKMLKACDHCGQINHINSNSCITQNCPRNRMNR